MIERRIVKVQGPDGESIWIDRDGKQHGMTARHADSHREAQVPVCGADCELPDAADLPRIMDTKRTDSEPSPEWSESVNRSGITFERSPAGQHLLDGTITAIDCDGAHTSLDELFACAPCMRDLDAMDDEQDGKYARMVDAVLNARTISEANDASNALAREFPDRMRDMSHHYDAERFDRPCPVIGCQLDH